MCIRHVLFICVLSLFCMIVLCTKIVKNDTYHNYEKLTEVLKQLNKTSYKNVHWNLSSVGVSREGRQLWVMEISAVPKNKTGVPNVKFIGSMHGNEAIGREILLQLLEYLANNYGKLQQVTYLLNNTRIHVMPNMNPDGSERALTNGSKTCQESHQYYIGSGNAVNIDLNYNFPARYFTNKLPPERETQAIMNWMKRIAFSLSISLDNKVARVTYPYDSQKEYRTPKIGSRSPEMSLTSDNDVFVHLAKSYVDNRGVKDAFDYKSCNKATNKILNGALSNDAPLVGSMQDYNYFEHGCMEITVTVACCRYERSPKKIARHFQGNINRLLNVCLQANRGIHGIVLDSGNNVPVRANIQVIERDMVFQNDQNGEFFRMLLPGNYSLKVSAEGYYESRVPFTVPDPGNAFPKLEHLTVHLLNSSVSTTTSTIIRTNTEIFSIATDDQNDNNGNDFIDDFLQPQVGSVISASIAQQITVYLLIVHYTLQIILVY